VGTISDARDLQGLVDELGEVDPDPANPEGLARGTGHPSPGVLTRIDASMGLAPRGTRIRHYFVVVGRHDPTAQAGDTVWGGSPKDPRILTLLSTLRNDYGLAHPRHTRWAFVTVTIVAALIVASCGGSTAQAPVTSRPVPATGFISETVPDTQVGVQLRWFLGSVADVPLSQQVIDTHFDSVFLSKVSANKINSVLEHNLVTPSGASLVGLLSKNPTSLVVVAVFGTGNWQVSISVDNAGLISGLLLRPYVSAPRSWPQIDRELSALAPQVSFLAAQVSSNGSCKAIHQVASSTPRPLASEFKLFVLGALAHEIAAGHVTWDQKLTVEDHLKSGGNAVGSGSLQYSPAGTKVSVLETATKMISISDNTAADMLINLVGRSAVESQVNEWSGSAAQDVPFLTTREVILMHYVDYPILADQYLSLSPIRRSAFLASSVDPLSLGEVQSSTQPRDVDTIEWFASPEDICRALGGLQRLSDHADLSQIRSAFSLNSGDLGLDHSQWSSVWFKGGSEPGVLTLSYLATNSRGQTFVVSAMTSNPAAPLSADATQDLLAVVKGAFALMS
jgi:hypothetical protein